ncbi:MAG TPA: 50S ribosomal protein L30 [Candidatus Binataceae bacterium]|jgi:large subunit ribosomal protein L30|nr:50S ribosomal protein L30 [Candidatus Binataceae bacterium]
MAERIEIRLTRSPIGTTRRVRETLRGLGLGRVGSRRTLSSTPAIAGMLRRVPHLVTVTPLDDGAKSESFSGNATAAQNSAPLTDNHETE